jgi:hypothetical protein
LAIDEATKIVLAEKTGIFNTKFTIEKDEHP